jgi:hypothetical protein
VTADTKDGIITLTGHVRTWAEHDAVVGAALPGRTTRYDKRDYVWRGTIDVASIRIWLRHPVP